MKNNKSNFGIIMITLLLAAASFFSVVVIINNSPSKTQRHNNTIVAATENESISQTPPPNTSVISTYYAVNCDNFVRLRAEPSTESSILANVAYSEKVGFIEQADNSFYKVNYNGKIGYVHSDYLTNDRTKVVTKSQYLNEYADVLENALKSVQSDIDTGFELAYINSDSIPELVYNVSSSHSSGAHVYTYVNGELTKLYCCSSPDYDIEEFGQFGHMYYSEKKNLVIDYYMNQGCISFGVHKIEYDELVLLDFFKDLSFSEFNNGDDFYINDKSVSESTYWNTLKKYGITKGYDFENYITSPADNRRPLTISEINSLRTSEEYTKQD